MNKLKPCPFCGGEATLIDDGFGRYFVECSMSDGICKVIPRTWSYDTKEEAIEAWNRRADNA